MTKNNISYDEVSLNGNFTKKFAEFLVNDSSRPLQTSEGDDKMALTAYKLNAESDLKIERISTLSTSDSDYDKKASYVKNTWEKLEPMQKVMFIQEYANHLTIAREGESDIGFTKNQKGDFEFPRAFEGFLKKKLHNEVQKVDVQKHWSKAPEDEKNSLLTQYLAQKTTTPEMREEISRRYDFRSKEGIARLEKETSDIKNGIGSFEEPSAFSNIAALIPQGIMRTVLSAGAMFASASATNTTHSPSESPTDNPTASPTKFRQSHVPSGEPSFRPTIVPTIAPSFRPSLRPSTTQPTGYPSYEDNHPDYGTTKSPTGLPTGQPTGQPTSQNHDNSMSGTEIGAIVGVIAGVGVLACCAYQLCRGGATREKGRGDKLPTVDCGL